MDAALPASGAQPAAVTAHLRRAARDVAHHHAARLSLPVRVNDRRAPAPLLGLAARRLPLPRADIGDPRAAVTCGVNAGADASQSFTAKGVGLLYPGSGPPAGPSYC